jgi:hypothetical protein
VQSQEIGYFSIFAQLISYMVWVILRAQCFLLYRMGLNVIFFHWQASYAVLLIKDGVVSGDQCLELLMVALNDHGKAVESLTNSIREMKKKLSDLELVMEELDNVKKSMKAAMVEKLRKTRNR